MVDRICLDPGRAWLHGVDGSARQAAFLKSHRTFRSLACVDRSEGGDGMQTTRNRQKIPVDSLELPDPIRALNDR